MNNLIFQKSLQDLVKGIRDNKSDPSTFIAKAISEVKRETKSTDPDVKCQAVRKLTYLQMIGYDVNWASFFIIEVMSQPKFTHKRVGYLAANQIFNASTEVTLLTVNLFKKEFQANNNPYEIGMAVCDFNML
jgi:AP-3 complex subunit delta